MLPAWPKWPRIVRNSVQWPPRQVKIRKTLLHGVPGLVFPRDRTTAAPAQLYVAAHDADWNDAAYVSSRLELHIKMTGYDYVAAACGDNSTLLGPFDATLVSPTFPAADTPYLKSIKLQTGLPLCQCLPLGVAHRACTRAAESVCGRWSTCATGTILGSSLANPTVSLSV